MIHALGMKSQQNTQSLGMKSQHNTHSLGLKTHQVYNNGAKSSSSGPIGGVQTHSQLSDSDPVGLKNYAVNKPAKKSYLEK